MKCRFFSKIIIATLVLIMSLGLIGCNSTNNKDKFKEFSNLSKQEKIVKMKEEVEYLCSNLEKKHINLYHSISKEDFEKKKEELITNIPQIEDEVDYYYALSELMTGLNDAHTAIGVSDDIMNESYFYDFDIKKFQEGWILMGIDKSNENLLGYKVTSINGIKIDEVFNRILNVMPHENPYKIANNFSLYVETAQLLKRVKVISDISENITVSLEDENQNSVDIKVSAAKDDNVQNEKHSLLRDKVKKTMTSNIKEEKYWFDKIDDNDLYVQYNKCMEDNTLPIKEFSKEISKKIEDNNFKKVILDFRYNGGGSSNVIEPLFDELQENKEKYNLKYYILIGNQTFSSAILNAYEGKKRLKATLVGQPTGGDLNHYGEVKKFELPYSGFSVAYSTKYFENIKNYDKDALYPDISVENTINDYIYGIDDDVQAAIKD
ncbi:hypothetical protein psyc5s11_23560 [Clostridium gelidum]|uniref:Peptidase S41 n=1 Tax=Clostridium gelidum TaxID=704125 RepID=A0ABN6J0W5_9CLOT|nr:hypothetical protein [Clostridium gelidum]BCZ46289.1 hypothetical protein psyc5s11_23560 [Clostridium gelidum]